MRKKKNNNGRAGKISNALVMAMGKVMWIGILAILFIALPIYGLFRITGEFEYGALRWVAVGLLLAWVPMFGFGYWFGHVEVRGFLGGFDRALEGLAQAVNMRDNSKIRVHEATRKKPKPETPNFNVFLPQDQGRPTYPQIPKMNLRAIGNNDDMVDL